MKATYPVPNAKAVDAITTATKPIGVVEPRYPAAVAITGILIGAKKKTPHDYKRAGVITITYTLIMISPYFADYSDLVVLVALVAQYEVQC
jgi:hypothetical protein